MIQAIQKIDISLFTWLLNIRIYPLLAKVCRYLSKTGDGHLYVLLLAMLYLFFGSKNPMLQVLLLGLAIERPLYFILKNTCRRNRPEQALENFYSVVAPSDQFSFPSGHTSAAFLVATVVSYFFPVLFFGVFIWAALIGFSRVILGVHFPTDIVMGMILGLVSAIVAIEWLAL